MGRIKTVRFKEPELTFSYTVNVDQEGMFSTTIPQEVAKQIKDAGMEVDYNYRTHNIGYFRDNTLQGVIDKVTACMKDFLSRELEKEEIVIQYQVKTWCSYCKNQKGEVVPNGSFEWVGSEDYRWQQGTEEQHSATYPHPYGMEIYAKPFKKSTFKYKSGQHTVEYERLTDRDVEDKKSQKNLYWLASITSMSEPHDSNIKEIKYTEAIAGFFVGFIKYICMVSEKLKGIEDPGILTKLIENSTKRLPFQGENDD